MELDLTCTEFQVGILRSIVGAMHLLTNMTQEYSSCNSSTGNQDRNTSCGLLERPNLQLQQHSSHVFPGCPWRAVERWYRVGFCRVGSDGTDWPVPCCTGGREQCYGGVYTVLKPLAGELRRYFFTEQAETSLLVSPVLLASCSVVSPLLCRGILPGHGAVGLYGSWSASW